MYWHKNRLIARHDYCTFKLSLDEKTLGKFEFSTVKLNSIIAFEEKCMALLQPYATLFLKYELASQKSAFFLNVNNNEHNLTKF